MTKRTTILRLFTKQIATIFVLFLLFSTRANAQLVRMNQAMHSVPSSLQFSPALEQDYSFAMNLVSVAGRVQTSSGSSWGSGLTYNNLFSLQSDGRLLITSNVLNKLEGMTTIQTAFSIETIGIYMKINSLQLGFYHRDVISTNIGIPKTLFEFIFKGNGAGTSFAYGTAVNITPELEMLHVRQFGINGSYGLFNNALRFGFGVKGNFGMGLISASAGKFKMSLTAGESQIQITKSGTIMTAGLTNLLSTVLDPKNTTSLNTPQEELKYISNFNNFGITLDFGLTYRFNQNLSIGIAVENIGPPLSFTTDISEMNIGTSGAVSYNGLNGTTFDFTDVINNAKGLFTPITYQKKTATKITLFLPYSMSAFFEYRFTPGIMLNGGFLGEFRFNQFYPTFYVNANFILARFSGNWLEFGANWSIDKFSPYNFGSGFTINLIPFQIYVMTDNIFQVLNWKSATIANFRFGVGLNI